MKARHLFKEVVSLLLLIFCCLIQSCNDEAIVFESYKGCCESPALTYFNSTPKRFLDSLGFPEDSSIISSYYIPNAFTPNLDGYNERFQIYSKDVHFRQFTDVKIKSSNGALLYSKNNFGITRHGDNTIWGGIDQSGEMYTGLFYYQLTFRSIFNQEITLEGNACSILCESKTNTISFSRCFFGTQHDGFGSIDYSLPTREDNCFE